MHIANKQVILSATELENVISTAGELATKGMKNDRIPYFSAMPHQ
jgi:hypothetical protein